MFKFDRYPNRPQAIVWSKQRLTALANKPKRQLKKLEKKVPLLADEIAKDEIKAVDIEEAKQTIQDSADRFDRNRRNFLAQKWKEARAEFRALPADIQAKVLHRYNNSHCPKNPIYLLSIIDVESGEQAKRLAKIEKEWQEHKQKLAEQQKTQLSFLMSFL